MPNDCPQDNSRYCKEYRERLKQDPVKQQALKQKKTEKQRLRRAQQRMKPVASPVASPSPEATVTPRRHPKLTFDNSANDLPQLPFEATAELAERRSHQWYQDNELALAALGLKLAEQVEPF